MYMHLEVTSCVPGYVAEALRTVFCYHLDQDHTCSKALLPQDDLCAGHGYHSVWLDLQMTVKVDKLL